MQVIKYKRTEALRTRGAVVALGFFDGVHLGHRALLERAVKEAARLGTESAVFTFAYGSGIKPKSPPIYSEREREELFASLGIDLCIVADFDELKSLGADEFISSVLLGHIGAAVAVVGYDYRFGRGGAADAAYLAAGLSAGGCRTVVLDAYMLHGEPVSSTRVRSCLEDGDVRSAWELLGEPYFVVGSVQHGRADGRRFGYPTVNVCVPDGAVHLRAGVYLTAVRLGEKLYTGLTNAGECPSFGRREYHTESFLTDFTGDAYGMEAKVYFLAFLRDERVFSSAEELGKQIELDRTRAEKIKGELKWQELGQSLR